MNAESKVFLSGTTAVKHYRESYYRWNERFNRKGEPYFLKNYPSPYFVKMTKEFEDRICLERLDVTLGDERGFNWKTIKRYVDVDALCRWLEELGRELSRLEISHRDINPGNVMMKHGNTRQFKLIDFGWAVEWSDVNAVSIHGRNASYSHDDLEAIDIMISQLREWSVDGLN